MLAKYKVDPVDEWSWDLKESIDGDLLKVSHVEAFFKAQEESINRYLNEPKIQENSELSNMFEHQLSELQLLKGEILG